MDALPDFTERDITDVIGIKRQMELLKSMIETGEAKQDEMLALRDGVSLFSILVRDR